MAQVQVLAGALEELLPILAAQELLELMAELQAPARTQAKQQELVRSLINQHLARRPR